MTKQFNKLKEDLKEWKNWCLDNPNESRGQIAYHLEKILEIVK